MIDWGIPAAIVVGLFIGMAMYGYHHGFGAQCKKMYPESEVKQMICVEKRGNGTTIEQIWEEL